VMDFRCVSGNESMNRALTNVYDQSPPFPYCNCAKALAEGAQQGSETSQKTGPTTQRVHSVTLPLPMSKLMGEGLIPRKQHKELLIVNPEMKLKQILLSRLPSLLAMISK
jgi:hypothetical protein